MSPGEIMYNYSTSGLITNSTLYLSIAGSKTIIPAIIPAIIATIIAGIIVALMRVSVHFSNKF